MPPLRLLVAVLFATLALAAPAHAQDNSATAVNQQDGSSEVDISFDFQRVVNGIVDQSNTAEAYASCTECQTVAIAIQIILVAGDVDVVAPQNLAVALNTECAACLTVAWAYQFVWGPGERFRLTGEARSQIAAIAKAFRELEDSGRPPQEILAETNKLLRDLSTALADGIEPIGPSRPVAEDERAGAEPEAEGTETGEATATPGAEATPPPAESPAPDGSATSTPEPTVTAEPSPSATPAP